jgi:hypothetical protein
MLRGDRPQRLPRAIPGVTRGHAGRQNRAQSAQPHAVHGRAARPPVRGGAATRAACDGGGSIDEAALEALGLAHRAEQALEHLRALGRPKQLWKPRVVAPSWRRRVEERDQVLGLSGAVRLDDLTLSLVSPDRKEYVLMKNKCYGALPCGASTAVKFNFQILFEQILIFFVTIFFKFCFCWFLKLFAAC